ncbi:MAG TPA: hypothetical protein DIT39_06840 [Tissierellales bacterium]|nr:hypothetical protein [Tissierellales bacterium]
MYILIALSPSGQKFMLSGSFIPKDGDISTISLKNHPLACISGLPIVIGYFPVAIVGIAVSGVLSYWKGNFVLSVFAGILLCLPGLGA